MKVLLAAFFGMILLTACLPVETGGGSTPAPGTRITLTRSVCFGFCPDYTVTITGDGHVTYEGRRFVRVKGTQTATVPSGAVTRLLAQFDEVDFFSLRDAYRAQMTDLPTQTITLTRNGRTKRVADYGGPGAGMPQAVRDLEAEIDRVANTAQWTRAANGEAVREP